MTWAICLTYDGTTAHNQGTRDEACIVIRSVTAYEGYESYDLDIL